MSGRTSQMGGVRRARRETNVWWLLNKFSWWCDTAVSWKSLTGVEKVQCLVEHIRVLNLGVTAVYDEGISDEETGMPDSRAWTFRCRRKGVTSHVSSGLNHPQIALDGGTVDQATHHVDVAFFGRNRVDGRAIPGKGTRVVRGVCQSALRPRVK